MTIDEEYATPVLNAIRSALKGNGVRGESVVIKNFEGSVLEFTAATHLHITAKMSERTVPGNKAGGKIFANRQSAFKEAENYASSLLNDPSNVEQIKNQIKQTPHHGFGLDNKSIKLPFLNQEFVSQEQCNTCQGKGQAQCAKCRGKGYQPCNNCNAQGFEKCNECNGNRQVRGPQGQMQTCNLCQGLGKTSCSFCRENRQVQCPICKTKGETQCKICGGQGAQSNIITNEIMAQCIYDFDATKLPQEAVVKFKELGADLANHAKTQPIKKDGEEKQENILHMFYDVTVPQANMEFVVKKQNVPVFIFGNEAAIHDIPDFLDKVIGPGLKKLEDAARAQGNINENIRAAVKYKTIKQAVMLCARYKSKKAAKALLHYTPIGLSAHSAQNLVVNANAALKNITKQQTLIAGILGASIGAVLGAAYYFSPMRDIITAQIPNTDIHLPIHGAVMIGCVLIGYTVWHIIASSARKKAINKIFSK